MIRLTSTETEWWKNAVRALAAAVAMLLLLPPESAPAATFTFVPCDGRSDGRNAGCFIINVNGELRLDDEYEFVWQLITRKVDIAVVALDGPGGNLLAAIKIGRIIRTRGYSTFVGNGRKCASACGIIWLAGARRLAERGARIGFHAAYVTGRNGFAAETGMGNALVGAYLNELGLSYKAIAYLTRASPYQMAWLTARDAQALGIDVEIADARAAVPPPLVVLPQAAAADVLPRQFHGQWCGIVGSDEDMQRVSTPCKDDYVIISASGVQYSNGTKCRIEAAANYKPRNPDYRNTYLARLVCSTNPSANGTYWFELIDGKRLYNHISSRSL